MVRFECQTISENIQKLKQEKFKAWMFVFKFKGIQGLSRFVRTLTSWLTETLIILYIRKTEFNNSFIIHCIFTTLSRKKWFVAQTTFGSQKKSSENDLKYHNNSIILEISFTYKVPIKIVQKDLLFAQKTFTKMPFVHVVLSPCCKLYTAGSTCT
jgi:hypothetical protein